MTDIYTAGRQTKWTCRVAILLVKVEETTEKNVSKYVQNINVCLKKIVSKISKRTIAHNDRT